MDKTIEKIQAFVAGVKDLANKLKTPENQASKFNEVKTADNANILSYDGETPIAGVPIYVMDEAGQRLPAPTADYVLEDGSTLKVQDGVIMEVVAGAVTEEQGAEGKVENTQATGSPAPTAQTAPPAPKAVVESIVKEYRFQEQLDELKLTIEAKDKLITELTEKFTASAEAQSKSEDTIKQMFALVEKISELPASDSKVDNKDKFRKKDEGKTSLEKEIAEFHKTVFK